MILGGLLSLLRRAHGFIRLVSDVEQPELFGLGCRIREGFSEHAEVFCWTGASVIHLVRVLSDVAARLAG